MNESSSSLVSCEQFPPFFTDEEIHEKSQGSNQRWELEADLKQKTGSWASGHENRLTHPFANHAVFAGQDGL